MAAVDCITNSPSDPLKAGISPLESFWKVSGGLLAAPDTKYLGATTPAAVYIAGGRVFSSLEIFLMVSGGLLAAPDTKYLGAQVLRVRREWRAVLTWLWIRKQPDF